MRTISADDNAIMLGGARTVAFRVQVKDSGGTYRDLTTYPGIDLVESIEWGEQLDDNGVGWSVRCTREQESVSLAPLMTNSPLNRGFNPAASYAPLLQVGRQMKVEYSLQAEDDPRARSWVTAFGGYIDTIDAAGGGDTISLTGRGLEAVIVNTFIERERIYAFCQGAWATHGAYVWQPLTDYIVGDLVVPTDSKRNDHFTRVTTAGTSGATEPSWNTGGGATTADGTVVHTESGATSTSAGTDIETVMQQILDDNGLGVVSLWVPTSPAYAVKWFMVQQQGVFEELARLADGCIGWGIRYMDDAGTAKLKLFDPLRSTTTSLRTFPPSHVERVARCYVDWKRIRNAGTAAYSDSQDLDASGTPKRKTITRTDSASITAFTRLFFGLSEKTGSNLDTSAEVTALLDRILSDCAQPDVDFEGALQYFFPFVELCDLYTFAADGVHFDADQKLAIVSYQHSITADQQTTSLRVRGKPASRSGAGWAEHMTDAIGAEQHALVAVQNTTPLTLVADTLPVGGTRISFDWESPRVGRDQRFELHLSTSSGFTPSSATLVATGSERSFEVGNLDPSFEHYAKLVPVTWNEQKPIRGQPSEELAFTPGRAKASHLNSDVKWGRLPLNGGFETQLDPTEPPDFWEVGGASSVWGTQVVTGTANRISGSQYLKLVTTSTAEAPSITSAIFTVTEGEWYAFTFWKKCVAGPGDTVSFGMVWLDGDKNVFDATSDEFLLTDDVGTWVKLRSTGAVAPGSARYAYLRVETTTSATAVRELHVDEFEFGPDVVERWHTVGATSEPTYDNSWVAFTGGTTDARFRRVGRRIELSGQVKSGSSGTAAIFTLPAAWRPAHPVIVPAASNGAYGELSISTAGVVAPLVGNTTKFSLDGISFPLD